MTSDMKLPDDLGILLKQSAEAVRNMTDAERAAMYEAQKASWVRGMSTGCEHGVLDFETCPQCRKRENAPFQK